VSVAAPARTKGAFDVAEEVEAGLATKRCDRCRTGSDRCRRREAGWGEDVGKVAL
jgi:hypothetical protein